MDKITRATIVKAFILATMIEVPLALWFVSVQEKIHSLSFVILGWFHLPGYLVARLVLSPFKYSLSDTTYDSLGMGLIGMTQILLIASVAFPVLRRRERLRWLLLAVVGILWLLNTVILVHLGVFALAILETAVLAGIAYLILRWKRQLMLPVLAGIAGSLTPPSGGSRWAELPKRLEAEN